MGIHLLGRDQEASEYGTNALVAQLVANAKTFGARGAGSSSQDDQPYLQSMLDSINTGAPSPGNGGEAFLPRGVYYVATPLVVKGIGCRLIGESAYGTVIKAAPSFVGEAVVVFQQTVGAAINTVQGLENIRIDCNNQPCHGVVTRKAYDFVYWNNVGIYGVADAYSAVRMLPDVGLSNKVSQTILWENVYGVHYADTATAPTFFFDTCQEAVFLGCKGFGGTSGGGLVAAAIPWYFQDCRGIVGVGCSAAQTASEAIHVTTALRASAGFDFEGWTFENVGQILVTDFPAAVNLNGTNSPWNYRGAWLPSTVYVPNDVVVNAGTLYYATTTFTSDATFSAGNWTTWPLDVEQVTLRAVRIQGTVGGLTLANLYKSDLEVRAQAVTVGNSCTQIRLVSSNADLATPVIVDNGTNTSIVGWNNAASGGDEVRFYPNVGVLKATSPGVRWRVPGRTNHWRLFWSASISSDFGMHFQHRGSEGSGTDILNLTSTQVQPQMDVAIADAKNVIVGTTTGSKIGSATAQKLGFWGATPIVQPTRAGQITDNSTGTSGGNTVAAVTSVATAADAIATLLAKVNALEAKLSAAAGGSGITA